jgi:hypothetical protein
MASELRVNTITSTTGVGTVTFGSGGASFSGTPTFNDVTLSSINGNAISGTRNRIINGDMKITQRGTSFTLNGSGGPTTGYGADRFLTDIGAGGGQIVVSNSTDVPSGQGFTNSLLYTVSNPRTMLAGEYTYIRQNVEGYNFADAMFGTSFASTFTLSFWVKSSISGTYGMFFGSAINARMSSASYTINSTNTWERKVIAIIPDTSSPSSWLKDNNVGLQVAWSMGCGSTYRVSPGVWQSSVVIGATGQTDLIATNGATFQVTGVQLESGSTATPFERRSYGQELQLCQRYFENINAFYRGSGSTSIATGFSWLTIPFKQPKRNTSYTLYSSSSVNGSYTSRTNTIQIYAAAGGNDALGAPTIYTSSLDSLSAYITNTSTPSSGLTGAQYCVWIDNEL